MKIKNFEPLRLFLKERFPNLVLTEKHENSINSVEKGEFYLYNYLDGLEVPRDDPIIRLCRGIVIRRDGKLMSFAFNRFFNYHESECDEVDIENADILEKLDGCVSGDTKIDLENGKTVNIKSIMGCRANWEKRRLIGFDEIKKEIVTTKIKAITHKKLKKPWVKLKMSNGKILKCTNDHKIYCDGEWIEAGKLKVGDKILSYSKEFNHYSEQVLLGSLIGDSSLTKNGNFYKVSHGQKEKEYTEWKSRIFNEIGGHIDTRISGFGTTIHRYISNTSPIFDKYYKMIKKDEKRYLSDIVNKLDFLGLAVWYMDDGSRAHSDKQLDRARIDCSRYKESDILNSIEILRKNLCLKASLLKYNENKFAICFNTESSKAIFNEISRYVPPCMERKLPCSVAPNGDNFKMIKNLYFKPVIETITSIEESEKEEVYYDIQTETGNFFAEGILIHNSLISVWHDGNDWRVTTRGSFPPAEQGIDYNKEFRRLFDKFPLLQKGFTYIFELISKENRIVTKYDKEFVALIGMTVLNTLQEVSQNSLDMMAREMGIRRPKRFKAKNINDCRALFEQMKDDEEGLVVVDGNANRFKLKQESYLKMARIMSLKDQDILDYVMGNAEIDTDFDKMPEVQERIEVVEEMYSEYKRLVEKVYSNIEDIESQKEFALLAVKIPFSGILFQLRKGITLEDIPLKYKNLEKWCEVKNWFKEKDL